MLFIAKYVAVTVFGSMVNVKKPRNEPSLHCKSALRGLWTSNSEIWSARAGITPAPKADEDVTAHGGVGISDFESSFACAPAVCRRRLAIM